MDDMQIGGMVRHFLTTMGGYLVAWGVVSGSMWEWIAGAVSVGAGAYWSWHKNKANEVITSAANTPGVTAVVTNATIADAIPNSKVVTPAQYRPADPLYPTPPLT